MIDIENDLRLMGRFSSGELRSWYRQHSPHEVVSSLLRRGMHFAKMPFSPRDYPREMKGGRREEIIKSILALSRLLCDSYDPKKGFHVCEQKDVFNDGTASKALRGIFVQKGWSRQVWSDGIVEHSSFRAAIGMALAIYALHIKNSVSTGNHQLALTQTADAFSLFQLDIEIKLSIKNRANKAQLEELPAIIMSNKGKDAAQKRLLSDPKQTEKRFINECWNEWQAGKRHYPSKAAFARDMLDKCEHLTSNKKIEDWCREWEKGVTEPA